MVLLRECLTASKNKEERERELKAGLTYADADTISPDSSEMTNHDVTRYTYLYRQDPRDRTATCIRELGPSPGFTNDVAAALFGMLRTSDMRS
ncbi:MAG: hypothetical protein Q9171_001722 [Xanthocarpia ochracea]